MTVAEEDLRGQRGRWLVQPELPGEIRAALPDTSVMLAHLLYCRGLQTPEAIRALLAGECVDHDASLLPDLPAAVERIARAVESAERVAVYGDFDCDGLTVAAVLQEALRAFGLDPVVWIPERADGHGLAPEALASLAGDDVTLVITADCGIGAIEEVQVAQGLGLDIIVTDHHEPRLDGSLPDCLAIDPARRDAVYPFRSLCGVGVAYKLVTALATHLPGRLHPDSLLDLVALGTVADVVPLVDENRSLVVRGLEYLRRTTRPGLLALAEVAGIVPDRIDAEAIAFYLAPRINAANRLASPRLAYDLITTADKHHARALAARLNVYNTRRQDLVHEYAAVLAAELGEPLALADAVAAGARPPVVIVTGDWPAGISGLLATRLTETYGFPAFVGVHAADGTVAVSGRGVAGAAIDLLLEGCVHAHPDDLFLAYGGHTGAGGFRVEAARFDVARTLLEEQARQHVTLDRAGPMVSIDAAVSLRQLTIDAARLIAGLAPFGAGFPAPLFLARELTVRQVRPINGKHVALKVAQGRYCVDAICFRAPAALQELRPDAVVDLVFHLEIDEWRGNSRVRLRIHDWRLR